MGLILATRQVLFKLRYNCFLLMSFDLYFCWREEKRVNFNDVKVWSESIPCFTRNLNQLWYENPATGVYFSFDFDAEPPKSPDDALELPPGYFDSGLSFNLNYNRPNYFALEAMPFVTLLAQHFSFGVSNPQENPSVLSPTTTNEPLINSWINHNKNGIITLTEHTGINLPTGMLSSASLYFWHYGKAHQELARSCGLGIYVPQMFPLRKSAETKAGTAIVYTRGLPTIVPECDWVIIVRSKRRFLIGKKEPEVVVARAQTFYEELGGCIRPFEWPRPLLRIIPSEFAAMAGKLSDKVPGTLPRSDFEVLARDSFVDIELPPNKSQATP